jgi:hypothetical protein
MVFNTIANADGVGVSLKIGTLGPGADLTVGLLSTVNLRLNVNGFSYKMKIEDEEDSAELTPEFNWFTAGGILDWHPGGGIFRISAGMFLNNNELTISANLNEPVEIGDHEYRLSDVHGKISFDNFAPYFGIGLGNAVSGGRWHVAFDLGVLLQGSPRVELSATAANPLVQPLLDVDVEKQRKDFEDDLKAFDIYPVLALGISYTF